MGRKNDWIDGVPVLFFVTGFFWGVAGFLGVELPVTPFGALLDFDVLIWDDFPELRT